MTTITFTAEGERITGFTCEGHSGYADAGQDIVCASISSALNLVECAVNTVLGLAASVKVDEAAARVSLRLPGGLSDETDQICQTLMASLMVYLTDLRDVYPDHITVLEV